MSYEFLEHTADVKFHATGKTIEEAYINSAKALFETIYGKIKIKERVEKEIKVEGEDLSSLLYLFLEEFLFLLDSQNLIFSKIKELKISKNKLGAVIVGDYAKNYSFTNDVKAITYNDMIIEKRKGLWVIEGVFDV